MPVQPAHPEPRLVSQRRPRLSRVQLDYMLAAAVRRREVFLAARTKLRSEHFGKAEKSHRIVWAAAREFFEEHGQLAERVPLKAWAASRVERDTTCTPQDLQEVCALVDLFFSAPPEELRIEPALGLLRRFLEDRLAQELAEALEHEETPVDFFGLLEAAKTRASDISLLAAEGIEEPFPETWSIEEDPLQLTSTGVAFIDHYLDGGLASKEVAIVLGAFGSRKSLLGLQLAVQQAEAYYTEWVENGRQGPLKQAYFLSYEDPLRDIRLRALSSTAMIPWSTLARGRLADLSTRDNLKAYEREMFAAPLAQGCAVGGERERLEAARVRLNRNWRVIDMSGRDDRHPDRGCGYVEEIRQLLESDLRRPRSDGIERAVGLVVVDYIKVCVARYMFSRNIQLDNTHHYVNKFPYFFKHEVLDAFDAAGVLLQQLDSRAQRAAVTHHAQSAEGKSVGENANFCFGLGAPDPRGLQTFGCTKARRAVGSPVRILGVHPHCLRLEDASPQYSYDANSKKIVERSEFGILEDLDTTDLRFEGPDEADSDYDIYGDDE